ncbi:hypothetical protein [Arthrobacter sp. Z4-13]
MTIDIKAMLHRVVDEVFNETFAVVDVIPEADPWLHSVRVSGRFGNDRTARIRASYEWANVFIPELDVGAILFEYDDVEDEKEAELRKLCLVMRAYLQGQGHIEKRRRLFRRGEVSVLKIEVDGYEWRLGRSTSSYGYIEPER